MEEMKWLPFAEPLPLAEPLPDELDEPVGVLLLLGYQVTVSRDDGEDGAWLLTAERPGSGERHFARAASLPELIEAVSAAIDLNLALDH